MKTDDLVEMLARGEVAVDTRTPLVRSAAALGAGVLAATALMSGMFGVQPDLASDMRMPMFWVKSAFVVALVWGGLLASWRLSRPGASLRGVLATIVAPVVAIWVLAAFVLMGADSAERTGLMLGRTWTVCATNIAILSVPIFVAALWAMKALAPTRLRLAGAAAGLLAGASAAVVYTLHCPELAAPFLGIWYVAGMLIPTAIGALIGPRVLRW